MELEQDLDFKRIESAVRAHTGSIGLRGLIEASDKPGRMRFIEGPPTLNGTPHAGHLRGRVIKDFWYRYNTLVGNKIAFSAGWDTQGLPVELQAEKELGITGGKSEVLRQIGPEKLVSECKKLVKKYNKAWAEVDDLLGVSLDQDSAYWTYADDFIEREWQILRQAHRNGILVEDHTVIAYCPSCQTSLSHAEVNQGYEEVSDPSLYYKVRLADEDAFLIVWTTMPFTLITDAMVGLHPDEEYNYVRTQGQTWVVGSTRMEQFFAEVGIDDYKVIKAAKGSEFGSRKYIHPLLDEIPALAWCAREENYHVTVPETFVDASTGSGLVHLSPANGEEDIAVARRRNVHIFSPIDDTVTFTGDAGRYAGLYVRDADTRVIDDLGKRGALVKSGTIRHKYPLCWRSGHPIVWLARKGWFYRLEALGDKAIAAAQDVQYFYDSPRNRFLGIVGERHPWCISRERIWGCPLPVWVCDDCSAHTWCFSRREIIDRAADLPDGPDFELHVPWINNVVVRCSSCSGTRTRREPYVLDTWHNSGSAPFSSLDDDAYRSQIPAPFLTEGIDQTRGWAYTLLIENVILNDAPVSPYRSFLFQGHVLDKDGSKMSKSRGNVLDGRDLLARHPVDLVRFYFLWKSSPIEPLNFDTREMMLRPYQVVSTLYHLHLYYLQNSRYDGFDGSYDIDSAAKAGLLTPADIWMLSKIQGLIREVTDLNDRCRFHESAKCIEEAVINSLSQTYIPMTRGDLWDEDDDQRQRRFAVYAVLRLVLSTLDIMIHPFCPFASQYMYMSAFGRHRHILLEDWPVPQEHLVNGPVEEAFDIMRECISVSAAARMKGKMKRRWPITGVTICLAPGQKAKLESLSAILPEQLNSEECRVCELRHRSGPGQVAEMISLGVPVVPVIQLNRKTIGPKAKHLMGSLMQKHASTDPHEILESLNRESRHVFELPDRLVLEQDDFVVSFDAAPGHAVSSRGDTIVVISVTRDAKMIARGLVKDVARRIQSLRKERGYDPTDVIDAVSVLDLDAESRGMLEDNSSDLRFLVRSKKIDFSGPVGQCKEYEIDGKRIRICI